MTMRDDVRNRVARAKACLAKLAEAGWRFSDDPATQAFCVARIDAISRSDLLARKIEQELGGKTWRAPRRLLLVISETDPLGTLEGFIAAYLVGSPMRIKSRLSRGWLEQLRESFLLGKDECEIEDWQSQSQDDERLLRDVDVALLAGGEEMIRHYRQVAPVTVRLVELGPKLSAMAIFGEEPPPIDDLVRDFALFTQRVCSSPRFVLVESESVAAMLFEQLKERLATMPSLPEAERLLQMARAREHVFRRSVAATGSELHHCPATGWGVMLDSAFDPDRWLPTGIPLIQGSVYKGLQQTRQRWPGRLQTLAVWGVPPGFSGADEGFTRVCRVGEMNARSILEPHDGFFMLAALVFFIGNGVAQDDQY